MFKSAIRDPYLFSFFEYRLLTPDYFILLLSLLPDRSMMMADYQSRQHRGYRSRLSKLDRHVIRKHKEIYPKESDLASILRYVNKICWTNRIKIVLYSDQLFWQTSLYQNCKWHYYIFQFFVHERGSSWGSVRWHYYEPLHGVSMAPEAPGHLKFW